MRETGAPPLTGALEEGSFARPAEWPDALPFPVGIDPARARITDAATGDLLLTYELRSTDIGSIAAWWSDALESRGFELRPPCEPQPSVCVHASDERVARFSTYPIGEAVRVTVHLLPPGHVPLSNLPGPCVEPPSPTREVMVHASGIDQSGEYREGSTHWKIASHPGPDLDGDGRPERLVPQHTSKTCPWEIPYDVYVMRGTCGHKVGTVVGPIDASTYTAPFRRGLREVHTTAEWATYGRARPEPEHHTRTRTFTFDGRRLRQTHDDTQSGICHHCGVAHCVDL